MHEGERDEDEEFEARAAISSNSTFWAGPAAHDDGCGTAAGEGGAEVEGEGAVGNQSHDGRHLTKEQGEEEAAQQRALHEMRGRFIAGIAPPAPAPSKREGLLESVMGVTRWCSAPEVGDAEEDAAMAAPADAAPIMLFSSDAGQPDWREANGALFSEGDEGSRDDGGKDVTQWAGGDMSAGRVEGVCHQGQKLAQQGDDESSIEPAPESRCEMENGARQGREVVDGGVDGGVEGVSNVLLDGKAEDEEMARRGGGHGQGEGAMGGAEEIEEGAERQVKVRGEGGGCGRREQVAEQSGGHASSLTPGRAQRAARQALKDELALAQRLAFWHPWADQSHLDFVCSLGLLLTNSTAHLVVIVARFIDWTMTNLLSIADQGNCGPQDKRKEHRGGDSRRCAPERHDCATRRDQGKA